MNYLYMGPSTAGYKYLLLLKDDLSSYVWLVPAESADAKTTVKALVAWFAAFGISKIWVSDRGTFQESSHGRSSKSIANSA
jgi:hypothetical protein